MSYGKEFEDYFRLFDFERNEKGECHSLDWPLFRSTEAITRVKAKAASYLAQGGLISVSHFQRAFAELKASGELHQVRQSDPLLAAYQPDEDEWTRERYFSTPTAEIIKRWREDANGATGFREQIQKLIDKGMI
jgi:hypothetical protein